MFYAGNRFGSKRKLRAEQLEARRLLAGDVAADVVDGDLILEGDRLSNHVEIHQAHDGTGALVIRGLALDDGVATTVNGQESVTVDGVTGDVLARMRRGNDTIYIHDVDLPGGLDVRTAAGKDAVLIGGLPRDIAFPAEPADLALASGEFDLASADSGLLEPGVIDPAPVDPAPVDPGPGEPVDPVPIDPILPFSNVTIAGDVHIGTGRGKDVITMGSVQVFGSFNIATGRHADQLTLGINHLPTPGTPPEAPAEVLGFVVPDEGINLPIDVYGSLTINTGRGHDQAWLESVHVSQDMFVDLGGGNDVLSYDWGYVEGQIFVDAGAGDDLVVLSHVNANAAIVDTGRGSDGLGLIAVDVFALIVDLGQDDDRMLLSDVTAAWAILDGGSGFDELQFEGSNNLGWLWLVNFEDIS